MIDVNPADVIVSVPYSSGQAMQPQISQNRKALAHMDLSRPDNRSIQPVFPKIVILHKTPLYLRETASETIVAKIIHQ